MFNIFDLFILVITIGFAYAGFREGLVRGVIKLAGFIFVIILLAVLAEDISNLAELLPLHPEIGVPVTFILLFVIAMIALHFIAEGLHTLIHMTPAGFIDSGLGVAFGMLKALLMGGLLALLMSYTPRDSFLYRQFDQSATAAPLRRFLAETIPYVRNAARTLYERYHLLPDRNDEREDNLYSI